MADQIQQIKVPDIGGAENVDVIEVQVKPGDEINVDDSLITLEGDKATMEVPSPMAGVVSEVALEKGDKVSQGSLILTLKVLGEGAKEESSKSESAKSEKAGKESKEKSEEAQLVAANKNMAEGKKEEHSQESPESTKAQAKTEAQTEQVSDVLAGPSARRLAREVGISISQISGSGEKGRITKDDVQNYIKQRMSSGAGGAGLALPEMPAVDFSKFGAIEEQPLSKIKKISGAALHRNWISIPHVTQFGETDITELEAFREQQKHQAEKRGYKLTPLVFIMKAVVAALKEFPIFNSSLDPSGGKVFLKKYFHIGVAVDTPNGLVVPVIRNVDQKGIMDLAKELAFVSKKVRETGLSLADMQGGCFSISSLGGIGGTAFTPIINAPEVAILGVSKSEKKLVHQNDGQFVPRLMLPLSLSYDHRVIDGAQGARFLVYLGELLSDIRNLLL